MLMIRSIVRPEKSQDVVKALMDAGYPAVTKIPVAGRGQQSGLKVGEVIYDELPKELLISVIKKSDKELVINTILAAAKTGEEGNYGDGKVFVSPVEDVYTISSGEKG
ncbi:MAG: P-II family nitrogen regulator [Spirochaetaceae bacterium]|nr:P-II family nitrogen regulator [Spirochaetaceae bacterium]